MSIAVGRGFIAGQAPELKPIEKLKYKITTKSPIDIRPPKLLLIAICSRLLQRPAPLLDTFVGCRFSLNAALFFANLLVEC